MRNFNTHDLLGELLERCPYPSDYRPPVEVVEMKKVEPPKKEEKTVNININININVEELAKKIKPFITE